MIAGLVVDSFAGGGGASLGIELAMGRSPDIAVNHDSQALSMHAANHPETMHLCENVFAVDPVKVCGGRRVALAWFSPDCTHHSKAKGGKPRKKNIRGLAWVVVRWARTVRPAVIMVENVEEFRDWGPLTREGNPCPTRKGQTFNFWVEKLRRYGYRVEWRELRACDYGAPTIRKRLFLVARCDGRPIIWPKPTHGPGLEPYRTAADIIDWSIPCPSIFERKKPLAEATLRRIAKGIMRYVIDAAEPFIVPITHHGSDRVHGIDEQLRTITTAHRGEFALVAPSITKFRSGATGQPIDEPLCTVTANSYIKRPGGAAPIGLVAAFLAQHNTDMVGHDARKPVSTIVGKGCTQGLVASTLIKLRNNATAQDTRQPLPTLTAGGGHVGAVSAFLVKYYSTGGQWAGCDEPIHTTTAKARMGLVTVTIEGQDYVLADIGMRMLSPRELFRAQGFPDSYIIDRTADGTPLTKTAQVRMCGNSVCPPVARALVLANVAADDIPLFGWAGSA